MSERSTHHAKFVIERTYAASPARVFAAWADPKAKARWFVGRDEAANSNHELDFRVGGRERVSGGPPGGRVLFFNAVYQDIVPNERIVYTYGMQLDATRMSVSLATVEFKPEGGGTRLIFTEQNVFLDGVDSAETRKRGTRDLLEHLDTALRREPVGAVHELDHVRRRRA